MDESILARSGSSVVYTWDPAKPWIWLLLMGIVLVVIIGIAVYSKIKNKQDDVADKSNLKEPDKKDVVNEPVIEEPITEEVDDGSITGEVVDEPATEEVVDEPTTEDTVEESEEEEPSTEDESKE